MMAELFIELFSEEIPARLQRRGAEDLQRLVTDALAPIAPAGQQIFHGPRRIALAATVQAIAEAASTEERGPRTTAPEQALAGFLRKHNATREALRAQGDFWILKKSTQAQPAAALIAGALPGLLWRFPWPKSMRWGGTSAFTWIRPLRRITCLLDGEIIPFTLAQGDDDGHGLTASNHTEGHRLHAPGPVAVSGASNWQETLRRKHVIADAAERTALIRDGIARLTKAQNLTIVEDSGLIDDVAGLVEWPIPLLGQIDETFMDLPPEVMQVSMRINQRYFATRNADGTPAPWFAFAANVEAADGGAAIIAGNERVLRARFADARHFYDLDRRTPLEERLEALKGITFQAQLGTQSDRVRRIVHLVTRLAPVLDADTELAKRAALLCKADLTTGMVGEFPELQGVMGAYYAAGDGEHPSVVEAIRDHYAPRGPGDTVPTGTVAIAVALADKLDQLVEFFAIGERPTGSGDPYALRRAALGVIRIIRENRRRLSLYNVLKDMAAHRRHPAELAAWVLSFIVDRLRLQLRAEGARYDILSAVYATSLGDDLTQMLMLTEAMSTFLLTEAGQNLLILCKRAANILRIEDKKDGPHTGGADTSLFTEPAEHSLQTALLRAACSKELLVKERFLEAMQMFAELRAPLDTFFETVTVNDNNPGLRINRLRLLASLRDLLNTVADFSVIENQN